MIGLIIAVLAVGIGGYFLGYMEGRKVVPTREDWLEAEKYFIDRRWELIREERNKEVNT